MYPNSRPTSCCTPTCGHTAVSCASVRSPYTVKGLVLDVRHKLPPRISSSDV